MLFDISRPTAFTKRFEDVLTFHRRIRSRTTTLSQFPLFPLLSGKRSENGRFPSPTILTTPPLRDVLLSLRPNSHHFVFFHRPGTAPPATLVKIGGYLMKMCHRRQCLYDSTDILDEFCVFRPDLLCTIHSTQGHHLLTELN